MAAWEKAVTIGLFIIAGYAIFSLCMYLVRAIIRRSQQNREALTWERATFLERTVRLIIAIAILITVIFLSAETLGWDLWTLLSGQWRGYLYAPILIILAHITIRLGTLLIDEFFERAESENRLSDPGRALTMKGLLKSVLRYTVDIAAWLLVLSNLGVNTTGLLASVGVAGLAIGFGAQSLVRDVITGFFILFEDQFKVGDYVEVAGISGIVEEMALRVTKIKSFSGELHIIPNGQIDKVTNYSVGPMRVMFEIPIAYNEDVRRAIQVIEDVCQKFAVEEQEVLVDPPVVLGVTGITDHTVTVSVWARTKPMQQWATERKLRMAIKNALDEVGILPPYPRQVWIPGSSQDGHQPDLAERDITETTTAPREQEGERG